MGTKTGDEAAVDTEAKHDEAKKDEAENQEGKDSGAAAADRAEETTGTSAEEAGPAAGEAPKDAAEDPADTADDDVDDAADGPVGETAQDDGPSGVGQGAGAVVSAVLGVVSLTGGWIGTVASARETLIGQLQTSSSASVATQVKEVYGDAWQTTALWAGAFALAALIVGVVVLARPAFGAPGRPQVGWIKSVAWAGVSLGVIGLLLAVLKYSDVILGLPSTS
ncbi:hypothetical protein ACFC09_26610 [Streptomyces sp. NPDC056161]|uniref:hypothetical protein n=1 Tax=Streptomyces sp. NPDC056161 TaxID=3345732 RepID=UPI0035D8CE9E